MSSSFDFTTVSQAARKDILELSRRIEAFKKGEEDEERFRHYRLTRGVYGQRQFGVQMFRTKIPFGKLTTDQLIRLADVSEKYTNGNLHMTTRQNIQMHYIKLDDSPKVWTELAQVGVTAREACGNTVRNLTASANAGVDPDELFDVSPYVFAVYEYFLRNPICQDMGRKIKPAFSSSDKDSAFTYFHDFGFIPRIKEENGEEIRGFKVVIGGGLGAVSMVAHDAYEFLHEDEIIPFMEAVIRVFDRYGEREKRMKARMKFLIKSLGFETFMALVEQERTALPFRKVKIDRDAVQVPAPAPYKAAPTQKPIDANAYDLWLRTNVFEQKQPGYYAVQIRLPLGDIDAERARQLARLVKQYAADDIRVTVNQGLLVKFLRPEILPYFYNQLAELKLAAPGFNSIADITACPGTDTCALGVTNSTGLARHLEEVIREEYPVLIEESDIKIKISGCMNACGQHMAAQIGFHGSSIKKGELVVPAMQIVLGGGVDASGIGFIAEKIIKLPTKRITAAFRLLLADYEQEAGDLEYYNAYVARQGRRYFYDLLKHLADIETLEGDELFDWGQNYEYLQEIGVGECAGVALDMVGTILMDAKEKLQQASEELEAGEWARAIYGAYLGFVVGAKALLLSKDVRCNTHRGIIDDFQTHFIVTGDLAAYHDFAETVLQINQNPPTKAFAHSYVRAANTFLSKVFDIREAQLQVAGGVDKLVIGHYYKA
ncbi:MAG: nitrite reductase [Saprospiraceae bacterium]